ncbi:MAG TPA: hypothetical protein DEP28_00100 [Bacteroidetes bacterium]|nr:VOC family protein [Ignavibacteria bacterium]HCA41632.1 hypothetical protein [Bacteroidota bacterium]HCN37378.1 hypothetical protein [Bacteroidota bacterium]
MSEKIQKLTSCIWFNNQAEEAVNYYISLFKDGEINQISKYGEGEFGTPGTVRTVSFKLFGQEFLAVNGGDYFKLSEAFSIIISCDTQEEIDLYWEKLSDGGEKQMCGWVKDKFGLSWQVTSSLVYKIGKTGKPEIFDKMVKDILQMKKIDISVLKKYDENQ